MLSNDLYRLHVEVDRQFGDLPPFQAAAAELNQAVLDLLALAIRAIEQAGRPGGRIAIATNFRTGEIVLRSVTAAARSTPRFHPSPTIRSSPSDHPESSADRGSPSATASSAAMADASNWTTVLRAAIASASSFPWSLPLAPRDRARNRADGSRPDSAFSRSSRLFRSAPWLWGLR